MIIEKLSSTAVKISIDRNEMQKYGVDFESFSENSSETAVMISEILKSIKYNTGMNFSSSKLFIEAFSAEGGKGCIIYISSINDEDEEEYDGYMYYIFDFKSIGHCIGFVNHFSDEYLKAFIFGSLYYTNPFFRLAVKINGDYEEFILSCASEFGTVSGYGETAFAFTDEHYECVIKDNAVTELFSLSHSE